MSLKNEEYIKNIIREMIALPNETEWRTCNAGELFEVPANSKFSIKVLEIADYCCSYIK